MKIKTKTDLKSWINQDLSRYKQRVTIKDWLLNNDNWHYYKYFKHLRKLEYYINTKQKFMGIVYAIIHKFDCNKLHLNTYPNTIGPGVRFYHIGNFSEIYPNAQVGANCTFLSGAVIGNKGIQLDSNCKTIIGDNCYFGLNCFVGGNIKVGNNVTVGANAIVTKDVPDDSIVVGNNRIIKK